MIKKKSGVIYVIFSNDFITDEDFVVIDIDTKL